MTDKDTDPVKTPANPTGGKPGPGETQKVDTKVQEDAAKEREVSGGYD